MLISVIVPVFNEGPRLAATLASVGAIGAGVEVIVVDATSVDDSLQIAARAGATVLVSSVRQRAAQMNLGARTARGEILLFLHADMRLPEGWREMLRDALGRAPDCVGGAFRRRFDSRSRVLAWTCRLADWRGRKFGWFLGDQAMFVRRDVFARLGGFAALRMFEDLDLSLRLARAGRTRLLDTVVTSSGRRFARQGALGRTLGDLVLTARFLLFRRQFLDEMPAGGARSRECPARAPDREAAVR